jgi:hypothetical protein
MVAHLGSLRDRRGLATWALGRGRSIGKLAAAGVLVTLSSGLAVFAVFLLIYISSGGH